MKKVNPKVAVVGTSGHEISSVLAHARGNFDKLTSPIASQQRYENNNIQSDADANSKLLKAQEKRDRRLARNKRNMKNANS